MEFGKRLDWQPADLGLQRTLRDYLAWAILKIRDKQGVAVRLAPNRAQRQFSRSCGRRNIVLKARQLGVTTWVAARFFLHTITRPGTVSVQVAHDLAAAEELFRIVRRFLDNLPEWLRKGALKTSRANVRQLIFPHLDSEYRVETAADPNAGRGLTIRNLHCSEVASWPLDPVETLASLRAAVPPDGEIVLESTPNGAGGCFYDQWQHADENGYVRHFFPWWWEESYRRPAINVLPLNEEEEKLTQEQGLAPEQIAFRREIQADFGERSAQEYAEDAESCFLSSGECVFELKQIEERLASCGEPLETRDNGRLQIWFPPAGKKSWIIGVDPAGGGARGDYACAQVIERSTGMQCAELLGHFNPQELASRVAGLAREYSNALVAVELNNHGHAVVAHLTRGEHYHRLYEQGNQLGWVTNKSSRIDLIENLAVLLRNQPQLFFSKRLLLECRTFVRHADGFMAAISGAHDDSVMAMAIAQMVKQKSPRSLRSP